jgi:hypothetical protein
MTKQKQITTNSMKNECNLVNKLNIAVYRGRSLHLADPTESTSTVLQTLQSSSCTHLLLLAYSILNKTSILLLPPHHCCTETGEYAAIRHLYTVPTQLKSMNSILILAHTNNSRLSVLVLHACLVAVVSSQHLNLTTRRDDRG